MKGLSLWVFMLLVAAGRCAAYVGVQWPLQIILGSPNDYLYGIETNVVDGWSDALNTLYAASAIGDVCLECNGTMSATLTGALGRYSYTASSVAAAIVVIPKSLSTDEYISTLNAGTGFAPVSCSHIDAADPDGGGNNFQCNILATTAVLQAPSLLSSVSGAANASAVGFGASSFAGAQLDMTSPLTLTQLGASAAGLRTMSAVNVADTGVTVQDGNGLTGVAFSTFVHSDARVLSSPPCSGRNASLLLETVATQVVGGDIVYCYALENVDVILVTAWSVTGTWSGLNATDCYDAINAGAVTMTLVFPQDFDTTGTNPFSYALFSQGGSLLCAYGVFQTVDPSDANSNFAELAFAYGFPAANYLSCDPDAEPISWIVPYGQTSFNYSMTPCALPGGSCAIDGSVLYLNIDSARQNGTLQLAPNSNVEGLIGPGGSTDTCLWLQVNSTPGIEGDGAEAAANGVITKATSLMYNSAKGLNHQSDISACMANIEADIGSLTIFNALSAGMSAVAAGAGVNAFSPPAFIAQRGGLYRVFPILASLVEAVLVNIAPLVYLVALPQKGTSTHVVSWFDVDTNGNADYQTLDVFVATDVTMAGRATFYALQWVVLIVCVLLSAALVMYRWHIRPRGKSAQDAPVVTKVRLSDALCSDALESKFSVESLESARSTTQMLADAESLQRVRLAAHG